MPRCQTQHVTTSEPAVPGSVEHLVGEAASLRTRAGTEPVSFATKTLNAAAHQLRILGRRVLAFDDENFFEPGVRPPQGPEQLPCQLLGDFGAEVIKVEHPAHGDGLRGHGMDKEGVPLWWKMVGRNKRTIGLNLSDRDGGEIFRRLARTADVIVENVRPGTLERWGRGYIELSRDNPGLVLVRVTGFGQLGPYADRAAFGTLVEAMSGFAHLTGQADGPPTLPPFGLADSIAGVAAANAATMALYHRDAQGGCGQTIDIALLEPMMAAVGPALIYADQLGLNQRRAGNRSENNAPRNVYPTADGHWVAVSTSADSVASRVLELVGHPKS